MKPIFQTIYSNTNGNCLAAAWASLLEKSIDDVPNFVDQEDYFGAECRFAKLHGYEYGGYLINPNRSLAPDVKSKYEWFSDKLPPFGHINGYYHATVFSPGYFNEEKQNEEGFEQICHAIIVDRDFNIVHDPNPAYQGTVRYPMADSVGFNGVMGVTIWLKQNSQP